MQIQRPTETNLLKLVAESHVSLNDHFGSIRSSAS